MAILKEYYLAEVASHSCAVGYLIELLQKRRMLMITSVTARSLAFHLKTIRGCLNLVLQISYKSKDATCTDDKVVATKQRCYKKLVLVFKKSFLDSFLGIQTHLQWQTANEQNTGYFLIEHSTDGINYTGIGKVTASNNYTFSDNYPQKGLNYYRLKIVDKDGKYTFSNVVQLQINNKQTKLKVYPNPAKDYILVKVPDSDNPSKIKLVDIVGRIIKIIEISKSDLQITINLKGISAGPYKIIWSGGVQTESETIIIE